MIEAIACYMAKVPDVIWSAVIASFLTFLGVLWANRGNAQRQRDLLEHEKEKYKYEQSIALKKEVFLEAAASFSRVLAIFPRLVDLTVSEKEYSQTIAEHGPAVSKTYLVAKEETVSKLLEFSNDVSETYLSLIGPRAKLLDFFNAIEIYKNMISKADGEKDRLLTIMKEINIQGRTDKAIFDYLQSSYDSENKIAASANESIEKCRDEMAPLHKEFIKECITQYARLSVSVAPMTIAVRKELDNDNDSQIFVDAISESMSRMKAAFGKLLGE